MLRSRVRNTTGTNTGVAKNIAHGLGALPDAWWWVHRSNRGVGRTYIAAVSTVSTVNIPLINALRSDCTLDVFTIRYQGRLY